MSIAHRGNTKVRVGMAALLLVVLLTSNARALITGAAGNAEVRDPGWPAGAAKVFNVPQRVAWWEGPPFGGGEYHGECRGDAVAFSRVLADFAVIEAKTKRLIIHDGVGKSFWLNPNRQAEKQVDARIDWVFVIWVPESFQRLRQLPADLRATGDATEPIPQIDVYTGGDIVWQDVLVPEGIEVVDNRLEAHGFSLSDGTVLDGTVTDLTTSSPLKAQVELQLVKPQEGGGYEYVSQQTVQTDDAGRWAIKQAPEGWHRVVATAPGYAARVVRYDTFDAEPRYLAVATGLSPGGSVSGRTLDADGQPLAGVKVDVFDISTPQGGRYELLSRPTATTAADGTFLLRDIPLGTASLRMGKPGYVRPGLGPKIDVPAAGLEYTLIHAAEVVITVKFDGVERPQGYMVSMEPEGGSVVGSWGGSGNIDETNSVHWKQIPPGRYVIFGRPNPGGDKEQTEPQTIELRGGETRDVVLQARKKE